MDVRYEQNIEKIHECYVFGATEIHKSMIFLCHMWTFSK